MIELMPEKTPFGIFLETIKDGETHSIRELAAKLKRGKKITREICKFAAYYKFIVIISSANHLITTVKVTEQFKHFLESTSS